MDGQKQRRQLLAELRGVVPPSHAHLLVHPLLKVGLFAPQRRPAGAALSGPPADGATDTPALQLVAGKASESGGLGDMGAVRGRSAQKSCCWNRNFFAAT